MPSLDSFTYLLTYILQRQFGNIIGRDHPF